MILNLKIQGDEPTITIPARALIIETQASWDSEIYCLVCGERIWLPKPKEKIKHKPDCIVGHALAQAKLTALRVAAENKCRTENSIIKPPSG